VSGAHRAERPGRGDLPRASSRVTVPTAEAMRDLGRALAGVLRAGDLLVLSGDLGAGKTTLTQGIGTGMRVRGEITSPTFVIARVHPSLVAGPALVHVDAYRLASMAEVDDLDLDATLAESVTVVEWGEGMVEELAADRLEVRLARPHGSPGGPDAPPTEGDEPRRVELTGFGTRWQEVTLPSEQGAALPPS
jgi:tRNA threonylcarbamoyladenosine biosynthesis protein TsaE